jgi:hypothetical protein
LRRLILALHRRWIYNSQRVGCSSRLAQEYHSSPVSELLQTFLCIETV